MTTCRALGDVWARLQLYALLPSRRAAGMAPKGGYPLFVADEEPVNRAVDLAILYTAMAAETLDQITPLPRLIELVGALLYELDLRSLVSRPRAGGEERISCCAREVEEP